MVTISNKMQLERQTIDAQQKLNSENYCQGSDSVCTAVCSYQVGTFIALME